jgi:cell division protein FtsI (penicillin-binding protein 3)
VRSLLYGRNVDRAAKARARIGLAISCSRRLCGDRGRLVMFAATSEATARRASPHDAVATARPDILDRNGEILATDVRTPSLFASRTASSTSTRRPSCSPP